MNIYVLLNRMINYIDENLDNEIDYHTLSNILCTNEYTMKSLFSLLCNISLAEYIRKRRLSNAGYDLYNTSEKIIDIAIKYGYDNATSFSRAFEKFHGIKPSQVKANPNKLKNFPKIVFNEDFIETKEIEYKIIELEEMILYGKGFKTNYKTIKHDAPIFFKKMKKNYDKYGSINYGMVVYEDRFESDNYEYWVLWNKKIEEFEQYKIPKSRWLVFKINSTKVMDVQNMINKFYHEFLPSCKYNLRNMPELEYYHDNITEFLIPIE